MEAARDGDLAALDALLASVGERLTTLGLMWGVGGFLMLVIAGDMAPEKIGRGRSRCAVGLVLVAIPVFFFSTCLVMVAVPELFGVAPGLDTYCKHHSDCRTPTITTYTDKIVLESHPSIHAFIAQTCGDNGKHPALGVRRLREEDERAEIGAVEHLDEEARELAV